MRRIEMRLPATGGVLTMALALCASPGSAGPTARKPAAAAKQARTIPALPTSICTHRRILVFDDARPIDLALDGMLAWTTMLVAQSKAGASNSQDLGPELVERLRASGCTVEHWREPSLYVSGGKRQVLLGEGKSEPYTPAHALTGKETDEYDVVLWLKQGQEEHTKQRHGEALMITFRNEAEVRVRARDKAKVDASWVYTEELRESLPYSEKEAEGQKIREAAVPTKTQAEQKFRTSLIDEIRRALEAPRPIGMSNP